MAFMSSFLIKYSVNMSEKVIDTYSIDKKKGALFKPQQKKERLACASVQSVQTRFSITQYADPCEIQ